MAIFGAPQASCRTSTWVTRSRSVVIRNAEPDRFERAALRWLARFCVEQREATLAELQAGEGAFENIIDEPGTLETLQRLCSR